MLSQQPPQTTTSEQLPQTTTSEQLPQTTTSEQLPQSDRFRSLCSELDEYEHLPELTPGATHPTPLITGQNHEETLDESILAGLTLP